MNRTSVGRVARLRLWAAVAAGAASCWPGGLLTQPARADETGNAVTISLSGSTAMRNFTISPGFSFLQPGTSITLNSGPGGAEVTYTASASDATNVQLAAGDANSFTPNPASGAAVDSANYLALRLEWHEQGSVEGILEMTNDQIGTVPSIALTNRNGNSGNPTWVNRNAFGRNGTAVVPAPPTFQTVTLNGFNLATSNYDTYANYAATGHNNQGGQNRVQMAISDVNARQGFSTAGGASALARTPGQAGYGLGNPALGLASGTDIQGLGTPSVRHQLVADTQLNMGTNKIDPATGANYTAGPWNTAGVGNLDNRAVAQTATLFVANPGTGLERVNRTDVQWLQTTGRLQNGADFNVATRDVNSGTLNVAALNTGTDPSWVVGENDKGNGNAANGGTTQIQIGPGITFSNKTSGGSQLRPTVQNARMAFGHLSMSDAIGSAKASASAPLRALHYRDDADELANGSNAQQTGDATFADPATGNDTTKDIVNGYVRPSARSITAGSYPLYQNETYVTVKRPNAAFAGDSVATWSARSDAATGIKGDNAGNDVRDVRQNILGSIAAWPNASSLSNPADALLGQSFLLPALMQVQKSADGLNMSTPNPAFLPGLRNVFLSSASAAAFNPDDPNLVTTGSGSTYGGNVAGQTGVAPVGGAIPITANNYLFGDFDQRAAGTGISGKGFRDFSDLDVARRAQAALGASNLGVDWNVNAGSNAQVVPGAPAEMNFAATKGDMIVMGDYNADGRFDGEDLRLMARGTALASSTSTTTLSGNFADALRTGVLRKNAALDSLQQPAAQGGANAQQRIDARAVVRDTAGAVAADLDPSGVNAFNRFDVNRDGVVDRRDAKIVDYFVLKDYRKLDDQLTAVVRTDNGSGSAAVGRDFAGQAFANGVTPLDPRDPANASIPRKAISLVDVELNDDGVITHIAPNPSDVSDFKLIRQALGPNLLDGDANFDGAVNGSDLSLLIANFGGTGKKWSQADFNFDGVVNGSDLSLLIANFGLGTAGESPLALRADFLALEAFAGEVGAPVPEPTTGALLALAGVGLLARRRRPRPAANQSAAPAGHGDTGI